MPIREVNIHEYRVPFGTDMDEHYRIASQFQTLSLRHMPSADLPVIDVYNLQGSTTNNQAGERDRRLVVYVNAGFHGANQQAYPENSVVINGEHTEFNIFFEPVDEENNIVIKSEENLPLAEYDKRREEMVILFDLLYDSPIAFRILEYIMQKLEELVWKPKLARYSWLHSEEKDELTRVFHDRVAHQQRQVIERDVHRLQEYENNITRYKQDIKRFYDEVIRLRKKVDSANTDVSEIGAKLIEQMDLIANHPKIVDLHIINGILHVFTDDIYAYNKLDERFYIGKMKFTIDMENTNVRFFNLNNCRRGFWTDQDPHPHVNGGGGGACLGNVASTIAELCAHHEAYALAVTCLDFLENANIDDPAGNTVYRWDKVDEEGNIIEEGHDDECGERCDYCEDYFGSEEDMYGTVWGRLDSDGDLDNEMYVCHGCRDNHFYWSEYYDEVVHEDIREPDEEEEVV